MLPLFRVMRHPNEMRMVQRTLKEAHSSRATAKSVARTSLEVLAATANTDDVLDDTSSHRLHYPEGGEACVFARAQSK